MPGGVVAELAGGVGAAHVGAAAGAAVGVDAAATVAAIAGAQGLNAAVLAGGDSVVGLLKLRTAAFVGIRRVSCQTVARQLDGAGVESFEGGGSGGAAGGVDVGEGAGGAVDAVGFGGLVALFEVGADGVDDVGAAGFAFAFAFTFALTFALAWQIEVDGWRWGWRAPDEADGHHRRHTHETVGALAHRAIIHRASSGTPSRGAAHAGGNCC